MILRVSRLWLAAASLGSLVAAVPRQHPTAAARTSATGYSNVQYVGYANVVLSRQMLLL